ncbi:MAG: RNB domain-containing ribonuclease [Actinomycetaceae bacterium]|nr:RNB domain-containing ribonuclease [Actinomycetaceae bacterium]
MPKRLLQTNVAGTEAVGDALARLRERLGLPSEFSDEVQADARQSAERGIADERLADRREIPFVTVDPAESRDLDQAVHIEREGEGYLVRYAISAVGLFITPGGPLDRAILERGQTIYGPDASIPLHPKVLSHGAASLLPGADRPAYLWYLHLDPDGSLRHTWVELAKIRSVAKLSYEQVQAAVDGVAPLGDGVPEDFPALLKEVGRRRLEQEEARGGVSLALPAQVVERTERGYRLSFRGLTDVEAWNAQISLTAGMAAAGLMSQADYGILRTMPAARERDVERLRHVARALGLVWPEGVSYSAFLRSVSADDPSGAAFLTEATSLFRGAGYHTLPAFEAEAEGSGASPASGDSGAPTAVGRHGEAGRHRGEPVLQHAALAARYAHVTAPLRRLVDRYGLEICRCICAGQEPPQWVRDGLASVPARMSTSSRVAGEYGRGALDAVEALVLAGREGEIFQGVVVDVARRQRGEEPGRHGAAAGQGAEGTRATGRVAGTIMLSDPAVLARITGEQLRRGQAEPAMLVRAEIASASVEFRAVRRRVGRR